MSMLMSVRMSVGTSLRMSMCMYLSMDFYMSVRMFVRMTVRMAVHMCKRVSLSLFFAYSFSAYVAVIPSFPSILSHKKDQIHLAYFYLFQKL